MTVIVLVSRVGQAKTLVTLRVIEGVSGKRG
jgi:hypothetical protein